MPEHRIADAFLSKIPFGANPLVDAIKGIQGIVDDFSESEKQKKVQQQPGIPPNLQSSLTTQNPAPQSGAGQVQNQSIIPDLLRRLLIPAGAAIAGSVNKNLLPQAAGLSTGFTKEITRQDTERGKERRRAEKQENQERKDAHKAAQDAATAINKTFPKMTPDEFLDSVAEIEQNILERRKLSVVDTGARQGLRRAAEIRSGDRFGKFRSQLRKGEVLIQRGNQIMAETEENIKEGDIRL